jgi:hypothetical protein
VKRDALATSRLPVIRSAARVSQLRSFTSSIAAVGKREMDVDLIQSALAVMLTGRFEHDPARCYAAPELFELRHVRRDGVFDVRGPGHALKLDFRRRLHLLLPLVCPISAPERPRRNQAVTIYH